MLTELTTPTRPRLPGAKLVLSAQTHFSKRYLKYLTKKFLKKNQLEVSPLSNIPHFESLY